MKFFKFLLQVLAMGLCFVAGMIYEKTLLQKALPNIEKSESNSIKKESIIINENAPIGEEDIVDEETGFNENNDITTINTQDTNAVNNYQKLEPATQNQINIPEEITTEETIIINDIEPRDDLMMEDNNNIPQLNQLPGDNNINSNPVKN